MQIILYAIPGFAFLIVAEWIYGLARGRNTYRLADTITSISLGAISRLRNLVFIGLGYWFYQWAAGGWHLLDLPNSGWGIWLFAMVAYDFSYYWFHRVSHEMNLFWAAHVVHHSSEDYNLGTALRQSGSGLFGFIFYLPWLVIGIPVEIFLAAGALNLVYQFWVHTEHVRRIGVLEWVLITPSNHRVHHAQNEIYIDRNYGGILCIWDRMFGSFQDELPEQPCIFGIRKPLHSYNPFWANLHVYWSTLKDAWHTKRWSDKLKIWFKGPGWRPADVADAFPMERVDLAEFRKYDPPASAGMGHYAFFQFLLTTLAGAWLLANHAVLETVSLYLLVGQACFSYLNQGFFSEGRLFALVLEAVRLISIVVTLAIVQPGPSLIVATSIYVVVSLLWLAWLHIRQRKGDESVAHRRAEHATARSN